MPSLTTSKTADQGRPSAGASRLRAARLLVATRELMSLGHFTREKQRVMFENIRRWFRRRKFREGTTHSRFIARDVRRDNLIVSATRIDEGIITGRVRTTNVLYVSRRLVPEPDFEPARELLIDQMWHWTGKSWGGLPDGTSIVDQLREGRAE